MERKIGEIFEYYGEWYQCIEGEWCRKCNFHRPNLGATQCNHYSRCMAFKRSDNKSVIFKKLEKVGEPFSDYCPSGRVIYFQSYKCYQKPIYTGNMIYWADDITISIEIKENMEEKKLNLKPFDLEAAKAGKPVCTRDGRKARIICFDLKGAEYPIVAAIKPHNCDTESLSAYDEKGKYNHEYESSNDLMMLPERKEGWVNVYRDCDGVNITKDDNIYSSKDAAIASAQIIDGDNYVATTIIKWEE